MTGDKIKELRLSLGWTQRQLSQYLCLHGGDRVSKMEQPGYEADGPTLKLLEILLGIDRAEAIIKTKALTSKPAVYHPDMIRTARSRKRMTQAAFGKLLGVSWQYVCYLETGARGISPRLCRLISMVKK